MKELDDDNAALTKRTLTELEASSDRVVDATYRIADALRERVRIIYSLQDQISPHRLAKVSAALSEAADTLLQLTHEIDELGKGATYEITFGDETIVLTYDENTLWDFLSQHPNEAFKIGEIREAGFKDDPSMDTAAVRTTLKSLTDKLAVDESPVHIDIQGQKRGTSYTLVAEVAQPSEPVASPPKPTPGERRKDVNETETIRKKITEGITRMIDTSIKPVFTQRELIFAIFDRTRVDTIEYELLKEVAAQDARLIQIRTQNGVEFRIKARSDEEDWIDREALANIANKTLENMILREQRIYSFTTLHTYLQHSRNIFLTADEENELRAILEADPRTQRVERSSISVNLATLPKALRPTPIEH